jgi:hypothetical protein
MVSNLRATYRTMAPYPERPAMQQCRRGIGRHAKKIIFVNLFICAKFKKMVKLIHFNRLLHLIWDQDERNDASDRFDLDIQKSEHSFHDLLLNPAIQKISPACWSRPPPNNSVQRAGSPAKTSSKVRSFPNRRWLSDARQSSQIRYLCLRVNHVSSSLELTLIISSADTTKPWSSLIKWRYRLPFLVMLEKATSLN